jgi:uncharacterized protein with NAD-binding domain and iron-sulfur cluster
MNTKPNKVIVIGGGIGGLTAAHELAERGFSVEVYDLRDIPGGKSRTMPVPNSGTEGRQPLPGEHGFRFFPAFYQHLPDSMKRIPFGNSTCFKNLVSATRLELALQGAAGIKLPTRFPRTPEDFQMLLADWHNSAVNFEPGEFRFYVERLWQVMTSCTERRLTELESISWWNFIGAQARSANYQRLLANGLSRSLVAAQPKVASARTIGQVQVHLLEGTFLPDMTTDRVLDGPTSTMLLNPWIEYLRQLGVSYQSNCEATEITVAADRVASVRVRDLINGDERTVTGDWFVAALPIERMAMLLNADLLRLDPRLAQIGNLARNVRWMNGIQFFLKTDVPCIAGHVLFLDSPWAITSISEAQFWKLPLASCGDGTVKGILSVDISDWNEPGILIRQPAMNVDAADIAREVWQELKVSLNVDGADLLRDDMLHSFFLDTDIKLPNPHRSINLEPLFINTPGSWQLRPTADTIVPNFVLAADYVQTNSDLACMEAANEGARRAVNTILDRVGSRSQRCRIWSMDMPALLAPWRLHDKHRFDRGLPWDGRLFSSSTSVAEEARIMATEQRLHRTMLRKLAAQPPLPTPVPTPQAAAALMPTDDAFHFKYYAGYPEVFWYVEWWYFNFTDKTTGRSGILTFAIFNPGDVDFLATASLNAIVFGPQGDPVSAMDYFPGADLDAGYDKADVTLADNRLSAIDASTYAVAARSKDGRITFDLTFKAADTPQLLADKVRGYEPWEISSWLVWMPSAKVSGIVSVDGQQFELTDAAGYHDHDWGIWAVPLRTWSWAAFAAPDKDMALDIGFHAAFQESTAYFRFRGERLFFPKFDAHQDGWQTWKTFWTYPTRMTFSAVDSTGRYKIDLAWQVTASSALWKYPLLVFEQTARYTGTLHKSENGSWSLVAQIDEIGFCEYTDTWVGQNKPDATTVDVTTA